MPWPPDQWRAIAATTMRRLGKKRGRRKLHEYKMEAGGHATTTSNVATGPQAKKKARRRG